MSWAIAVAFFVIGLLTRLPFRTEHLYEHDSVLYARAIESFDPAQQRPHPPGYLWYVALARATTALTGDANAALTLISAIAGAGAVALVYALGARLYDERTGRIAAMFLLTSVTFWARGIVAYPYTILALLTVGIALLLWRACDGAAARAVRERRFFGAGAAWGIAVGFRPDLAPFLAPLWLLTVTLARPRAIAAAASAGAVAVGTLAWLLATGAAMPGGLSAFVATLRAQGEFVSSHLAPNQANGPEIADNVRATARFIARALYALAPLVVAFAISRELRRLRRDPRLLFLLVWTLVPLPLYVVVHVGEYGHVFSMLGGLVILAARGAIAVASAFRSPRVLRALVATAVAANASIFLLTDTPLSAAAIARHDRGIAEKAAWIRANVDPTDAAIVTAYEKVLIEHYVGREYHVVEHPTVPAPAPERAPLCTPGERCPRLLILWDELFANDSNWREVAFPSGTTLRLAEEHDASALRLRQRRIRAVPGP